MEPLPDERSIATPQTSPDHQLPPAGGKLQRIGDHSKSAFAELRTWIDLRLKLAQMEMREELNRMISQLGLTLGAAVFGALTGFFFLITVALLLGLLLGHPVWGFAIVTVVLGLVAGILWAVRGRVSFFDPVTVTVDEEEAPPREAAEQ